MNYGLTLVTPASVEPITVDELKAHLRIADHDADNAILTAIISAAREYVEIRLDRQLVTATWKLWLDRFPGAYSEYAAPVTWRSGVIRVPRPPLQSVTTLEYVDTDGALQTLATSEYQVSTSRSPGRIAPARFKVWPVTDPLTMDAVRVTFVAGYGLAASVPPRSIQAIKLLAGHLYENREDSTEMALSRIPCGLEAFLRTLSYGEYC